MIPIVEEEKESGVGRWWKNGTAMVAWIAVGTIGVHLLTGWRYGFDRDELMALEDARHLAWGYVAYPPMTPFFGRVALELFGTSLVGFRFFAALVQAVALVLTGLMAKEMGGGRWAQVVAALAGVGWTLSASELWVAAQRAMPGWARGRMSATVIMVSQGAMALGGIIWGTAAATMGVNPTLTGGAVLLFLSLVLAIPLSLDFTTKLNFEPAPVTSFSHKLIHMPQPHDGPVAIVYEFQVDRSRGSEFVQLAREVRLIHLRNGAFSWRLYEDLERFNTFRIEMMVPSWTEHLLQTERMTKAERETIDRIRALHVGDGPIENRIFLCVNKELHAHRHTTTHPSSLPTSPLDLGTPEIESTA